MTCSRSASEGHIVWDLIGIDGETTNIYDSDSENEPIEGYALVGEGDENNFDLRITIAENTSMLTRCTVREDGKDTVSSVAMVYLVGEFNHLHPYVNSHISIYPYFYVDKILLEIMKPMLLNFTSILKKYFGGTMYNIVVLTCGVSVIL